MSEEQGAAVAAPLLLEGDEAASPCMRLVPLPRAKTRAFSSASSVASSSRSGLLTQALALTPRTPARRRSRFTADTPPSLHPDMVSALAFDGSGEDEPEQPLPPLQRGDKKNTKCIGCLRVHGVDGSYFHVAVFVEWPYSDGRG